eukprot:8819489-Ditylum_brightwellii.AAC.1
MSTVDNTMSGVAMQLCNAVTAILNGNEQADYVAKHHGGSQSIWFPNGDNVPLEYNEMKYKVFAKCCLPIPMEVKTIPIQWIDCHIDDLEINIVNSAESTEKDPSLEPVDHPNQEPKEKEQVLRSNILTSRTQEVSQQKEENNNGINWEDTLGHCMEEVITKMLENTTQYFSTCMESETQAYPIQHCQKQLFPLHLPMLKGRTCADMLFSSIFSRSNYSGKNPKCQ